MRIAVRAILCVVMVAVFLGYTWVLNTYAHAPSLFIAMLAAIICTILTYFAIAGIWLLAGQVQKEIEDALKG